MEVLFDTHPAIRTTEGFLRSVQSTPTIHPEPVIRPDCAADANGVSAYGTVLREGGRFRAWYQAMPANWDYKEDVSHVAYAESDDGIHWTKPALNLIDAGIGPNNICNLALHCPSLFVDPDAAPEAHYRATGFLRPYHHPTANKELSMGYYSAHSADGLHWQLEEKQLWPGCIGDVCTSIYHPIQQRAITAHKDTVRVNAMKRRCINMAEYRNGQFSESHAALYPDEFDDVCAVSRGFRSADYYGMGMMPAGRGTVGFLWKYWHELPYAPLYSANGFPSLGLYGPADIALVYQSEPGAKWFHMPGRPDFISRQALPWSQGWIYSSSTVVEVGDEQRLYYSGRPGFHGFELNPQWQPIPEWADWSRRHQVGGLTFASWPRWRLFGYESPRDGSFTLNLGVLTRPVKVLLNYTTYYDGCVRASVAGCPGHSLEECQPLTTQSLAAPVAWKNGIQVSPQENHPVYLTIHLSNATCWAYEVQPIE